MRKLRVPKHEVKKAIDLLAGGINKNVVAVLNDVEKTPTFEVHNQKYGGQTLPKFMVINGAQDYYGDKSIISLNIYNPESISEGLRSILVKPGFELKVLVGSVGKSFVKKVIDHQFKTGINLLPRVNTTTGTDPEMFVEVGDTVLPAFEFLGGKKEGKNQTEDGGKLYWDGFQAEFDVRAQGCLEGVCRSILAGLRSLSTAAKKVNSKAKLSYKTVIQAPAEVLAKAKQEHVELGCMPSYNVYGHEGNIVEDARQLVTRSAGGHIHLGLNRNPSEKQTPESVANIVKAMDAILGVCCVAMFAGYDSPERRRFYGLAGEFRLPPHGLEYRTLSNAWLMHPLVMHMVFDLARKSASFGANGLLSRWKATEAETIKCINTCNVELARKIMMKNKETLIAIFKSTYPGQTNEVIEAVFNGFYNGVDSFIKNPKDIEANWQINSDGNRVAVDKTVRGTTSVLVKGQKVA